jgi:RNAse (barnase) inhibitor barstar
MAVFSGDDFQRIDYGLMQNGSITLYFRPAVLSEEVKALKELNYQIDEFDCTTWNCVAEMHKQIAVKLNFPQYFGRNLDALNDCISDIEIPDESGRVLVLHRFDDFATREQETAWHLLDIITRNSWLWLLEGKRFFALAQSDDPKTRFDNLGLQSTSWNGTEWLNSSRGL